MLAVFGSISSQISAGRVALTKLRSAEKITTREAGHIIVLGVGMFAALYVMLATTDLMFVLDAATRPCTGDACEWSIDKGPVLESLHMTLVVTSILFGLMAWAVTCEVIGKRWSHLLSR